MYVRDVRGLGDAKNTQALCLSMPWFLGSIFGACRDTYTTVGANVYDRAMYGGSAPKPPPPQKPDQSAAETIAAINARIAEEEAKGYRPANPTLPGLTAQEMSDDLEAAQEAINDAVYSYVPYAIAAGVVVLALMLKR